MSTLPGVPPPSPTNPAAGTTPPAGAPTAPPGTVTAAHAPGAEPPGGETPPTAPPGTTPPVATPPREAPPATAPGAPGTGQPATGTPAQIILTPPGTIFQVAGGPYTVPVSINNAMRVSTITLTISYNPAVLKVRTASDGTFMRQGGVTASFTPKIDPNGGRVDIVISRTSDQTGASGSGLLAALLFDAVGAGASQISVSGLAVGPDGAPVALTMAPVTVTVRWRGGRREVGGAEMQSRGNKRGFTFVELLVVCTILLILASAIMPLAKVSMQRQREAELRRALREMRMAIDKFKDAADAGGISAFDIKPGAENYPASLEVLVEGVTKANDATGIKLKFL